MTPEHIIAGNSQGFTTKMKVDSGDVSVYRSTSSSFATWTQVNRLYCFFETYFWKNACFEMLLKMVKAKNTNMSVFLH